MTEATYWRELIRPVFEGRKVVLTGNPAAGQTALVAELRDFGAADVFVLGEGMGTGPAPDCDYHLLDVSGATIMEAIRAGITALRDLPTDACAALDRFDPGGEALVVGTFLNEAPEVAGRPCLAWRLQEWVALEDKTVVDALWDDVGVGHAPSRVVDVADLVDETDVVWAGDARDGFHGGADLTYWIRDAADLADARTAMQAQCDRVRVMPFLEGIPCSIHGLVFPDRVATFRPVEMITLRRPQPPHFFYAGASTYWDPLDADREAMRDIARRVGEALRERVGFRGAFTVDGVMTEAGFLPTELNPRMGAGLGQIAFAVADMPINLLNQCVIAGCDLAWRAAEFEALVTESADASRSGGTWRAVPTAVPPTDEPRRLAWSGDAWRAAAADEPSDARMMVGPSSVGGFLRLSLAPGRTPAGPSIGDKATAFYAFTDAELGTQVGPLGCAQDVRVPFA